MIQQVLLPAPSSLLPAFPLSVVWQLEVAVSFQPSAVKHCCEPRWRCAVAPWRETLRLHDGWPQNTPLAAK
jgi:hypothetical protein